MPLWAVVARGRIRVGGRREERTAMESFVPTSGGFGLGSKTFGVCTTASEGCGGIWPRRKSSWSLYVPERRVV